MTTTAVRANRITATTPNSSSRGHHSYGSLFKRQSSQSAVHKCGSQTTTDKRSNANGQTINFEEFCVISAYLSVLQQEMNENTCVSPIKGMNQKPPLIFLTNTLGKREGGKELNQGSNHTINP